MAPGLIVVTAGVAAGPLAKRTTDVVVPSPEPLKVTVAEAEARFAGAGALPATANRVPDTGTVVGVPLIAPAVPMAPGPLLPALPCVTRPVAGVAVIWDDATVARAVAATAAACNVVDEGVRDICMNSDDRPCGGRLPLLRRVADGVRFATLEDARDGSGSVGRDDACLNTTTAAAMAATAAMAPMVAATPPTLVIDKADAAAPAAVPPAAAALLTPTAPAPTPPSDTPPTVASAPPAPPLWAVWDRRIGPALESNPALSVAGTVSGIARSSLRLSLRARSCAAQISHSRACAAARTRSSLLPS